MIAAYRPGDRHAQGASNADHAMTTRLMSLLLAKTRPSDCPFSPGLNQRLRQPRAAFPRPLDACAGNAVANQGNPVFTIAQPEAPYRRFRTGMSPKVGGFDLNRP